MAVVELSAQKHIITTFYLSLKSSWNLLTIEVTPVNSCFYKYQSCCSGGSDHVFPVLGAVPRSAAALHLWPRLEPLLHGQRVALLHSRLLLLLLLHCQPRAVQHHVRQLPQRVQGDAVRPSQPGVSLQYPRELRGRSVAAHAHVAQQPGNTWRIGSHMGRYRQQMATTAFLEFLKFSLILAYNKSGK